MYRWPAIVEIVKSFNAAGRPGLAFAAFLADALVRPVVIVGVIALGGALRWAGA